MLNIFKLIFLKLFTPKNMVTQIHSRSCLRAPFDSQRVNGSQTLQKSATEHFLPIFSSFLNKTIQKKFLLVSSEVLGQFLDPLKADAKYSCHSTLP